MYQTTNILMHGDIDPGFCLMDRADCSRLRSVTLAQFSPATPLLDHLRTLHPPALDLCTRWNLQKSPHEGACLLTVLLHLGQGFQRLSGPLSLLGCMALKASPLPAKAATRSHPLFLRTCFTQERMLIRSWWPWQEPNPSLLPLEAPTWGLLGHTSSQEEILMHSGQVLQPCPSARVRKSLLAFHAPQCHLRPTSSSLAMASCMSAGRILAPSTHRNTWKTWLMVVTLLLFWVHQTPEETWRCKASWFVPQAGLQNLPSYCDFWLWKGK